MRETEGDARASSRGRPAQSPPCAGGADARASGRAYPRMEKRTARKAGYPRASCLGRPAQRTRARAGPTRARRAGAIPSGKIDCAEGGRRARVGPGPSSAENPCAGGADARAPGGAHPEWTDTARKGGDARASDLGRPARRAHALAGATRARRDGPVLSGKTHCAKGVATRARRAWAAQRREPVRGQGWHARVGPGPS